MKLFFYWLLFFTSFLFSQETKFPIKLKSGHLYSDWIIDKSIKTKVFLETGFSKILIDKKFADKYLTNLVKKVEAEDNVFVSSWGDANKYKVDFYIEGFLTVNGQNIKIDGIVMDFSLHESWRDCDMVFPLKDLNNAVEINIKENYMKIVMLTDSVLKEYYSLSVNSDNLTKGLSIIETIEVIDSNGNGEKLKGNFIFDLGAANAFYLNRNQPEVDLFIEKSQRMILKDTSRIGPNNINQLSVIIPNKINFGNLEISETYIVAMKMMVSKSANQYLGVIGNKFFENTSVIFDFNNNRIHLKPNSNLIKINR